MRTGLCIRVACAALLGTGMVEAGPRDQPELAEGTAVETLDLAAWMKQLQGRFVFEGSIHHHANIDIDGNGLFIPYDEVVGESVGDVDETMRNWSQPIAGGKADCIGFSDGPGLQCVAYVDWPFGPDGDLVVSAPPELSRTAPSTQVYNVPPPAGLGMGASGLKPGMILAGLAPSAAGTIRFLLGDDKGLAHPGALTQRGNAVIAKPPCVNQPGKLVCEQIFRIEARPDSRIIYVTFDVRTVFLMLLAALPPKPEAVLPAVHGIMKIEELVTISFALRREAEVARDP